MNSPLLNSSIPGVPLAARGKVRDMYDLGETLLIVTSDRISAFDVVMASGIPQKGRVLTQLSRFWFRHLRVAIPNHYITTDLDFILSRLEAAGAQVSDALAVELAGRSMLVVKTSIFQVECVARGYLAGSLWKEYVEAGGKTQDVTLHEIRLPGGLKESDRLPEPIFTPATKAASGHDMNIGLAEMSAIVGEEMAERLRETTLNLYARASAYALERGLILADTKFEFGLQANVLTLSDEALTPDSSRYWAVDDYAPGRSQPSFDKQYLRDWLQGSGWNKEPPPPTIPDEIVANTAAKYREAYVRITGSELPSLMG